MLNIPHFPSFYIYHNYQSIVNRYIFSYLLNEYNKKRDFDNTKDYVGKYFFIEDSTRNRIRYFSIIIDCSTGDDSWGLTDDDSTWN